MPEYSVVVTTYNHGDYIRACLESVVDQTFEDFEVIVIDDGSPDHTEREVAKVNDARISYTKQSPSGLPAFSRNRGIERAKGRLIAFLDGDDIWYPEKLARCRDSFITHPEIDLVCHNEIMRDSTGAVVKTQSYGPVAPDMFRRLLYHGSCLSPSATVIKKEVFTEKNLYFREDTIFSTAEDYDLWLRLSREHIFYFLDEVLGEFNWHGANASANYEKHYLSQIEVIRDNYRALRGKRLLDRLLFQMAQSKLHLILSKDSLKRRSPIRFLKYLIRAIPHPRPRSGSRISP